MMVRTGDPTSRPLISSPTAPAAPQPPTGPAHLPCRVTEYLASADPIYRVTQRARS